MSGNGNNDGSWIFDDYKTLAEQLKRKSSWDSAFSSLQSKLVNLTEENKELIKRLLQDPALARAVLNIVVEKSTIAHLETHFLALLEMGAATILFPTFEALSDILTLLGSRESGEGLAEKDAIEGLSDDALKRLTEKIFQKIELENEDILEFTQWDDIERLSNLTANSVMNDVVSAIDQDKDTQPEWTTEKIFRKIRFEMKHEDIVDTHEDIVDTIDKLVFYLQSKVNIYPKTFTYPKCEELKTMIKFLDKTVFLDIPTLAIDYFKFLTDLKFMMDEYKKSSGWGGDDKMRKIFWKNLYDNPPIKTESLTQVLAFLKDFQQSFLQQKSKIISQETYEAMAYSVCAVLENDNVKHYFESCGISLVIKEKGKNLIEYLKDKTGRDSRNPFLSLSSQYKHLSDVVDLLCFLLSEHKVKYVDNDNSSVNEQKDKVVDVAELGVTLEAICQRIGKEGTIRKYFSEDKAAASSEKLETQRADSFSYGNGKNSSSIFSSHTRQEHKLDSGGQKIQDESNVDDDSSTYHT